jgi:hypothetical protein
LLAVRADELWFLPFRAWLFRSRKKKAAQDAG